VANAATGTERRARRRYPIHLPLCGWILGRQQRAIAGTTVNMSSTGILFVASEAIPARTSLRLLIEWPIPSIEGQPLQLAADAKVVRSVRKLVAVRFHDYGLRIADVSG
jgi:hypothetical protein